MRPALLSYSKFPTGFTRAGETMLDGSTYRLHPEQPAAPAKIQQHHSQTLLRPTSVFQ